MIIPVLFLVALVLFVLLPVIGMALWAFLSTILVGLVVGALGRLVVPGQTRIGIVATILAGLCGSVFGGFLGQHVLGVGWLGTVLIEVAVSASVVFLLARRSHRQSVRS